MQITRLQLRRLRRFDELDFLPGPGLNLIIGDNGAGKTSVLEAMHLMAYGRSFRGRVRDGLIQAGAPALEVFVEWQERTTGRVRRGGLRHSGQAWEGRLDGAPVAQLSDLCAALAVVTFEPGSHALITGAAEHRRRYLDWGLFHVEQAFLPHWRRYARALRQRNALLKAGGGDGQLDAWDRELADAGEAIARHRDAYLDALAPAVDAMAAELAPMLGGVRLEHAPGWRRESMPLADALLLARDRDRQTGYTSVGPHRADWRIAFGALPGREALSRGQAKLTALAALLAQAAHYARVRGEWPVVALDDLASELDARHRLRVLRHLASNGAQVFVTGTEAPPLDDLPAPPLLFHVEQGRLSPVR